MPSDLVLVAVLAQIGLIAAAWISSHRKLTHITNVTNSNLQKATDKAADLEAQLSALRDGELKAAMERIDKLEAIVQELRDERMPAKTEAATTKPPDPVEP